MGTCRNVTFNFLFRSFSDYITNTEMFDLENDLPDDLLSSGSWGSATESTKPPATGPGPGQQNGALDSELRQHVQQQQQLSHHLIQQQVCVCQLLYLCYRF